LNNTKVIEELFKDGYLIGAGKMLENLYKYKLRVNLSGVIISLLWEIYTVIWREYYLSA